MMTSLLQTFYFIYHISILISFKYSRKRWKCLQCWYLSTERYQYSRQRQLANQRPLHYIRLHGRGRFTEGVWNNGHFHAGNRLHRREWQISFVNALYKYVYWGEKTNIVERHSQGGKIDVDRLPDDISFTRKHNKNVQFITDSSLKTTHWGRIKAILVNCLFCSWF